MNTLRLFASLSLALVLCACPETHVAPDFGYKAAVLDPTDWDGTWQIFADDNLANLTVSDAANGQITLTEVPKDKKDKPDKPSVLSLRESSLGKDGDDKLYFSTMPEKDEDTSKLSPYLLRADKDGIVLWMVNSDAVAEAIKAGKLKGSITKPDKDGPHCRLDSDPANYPLLTQPQFWNWKEPIMIRRVKKA